MTRARTPRNISNLAQLYALRKLVTVGGQEWLIIQLARQGRWQRHDDSFF